MKAIPKPTEKTMLGKLLMSLSEKYELQGARISVDYREVRATFIFPEHELPKLREIANDWADGGCGEDSSTLGSIRTSSKTGNNAGAP